MSRKDKGGTRKLESLIKTLRTRQQQLNEQKDRLKSMLIQQEQLEAESRAKNEQNKALQKEIETKTIKCHELRFSILMEAKPEVTAAIKREEEIKRLRIKYRKEYQALFDQNTMIETSAQNKFSTLKRHLDDEQQKARGYQRSIEERQREMEYLLCLLTGAPLPAKISQQQSTEKTVKTDLSSSKLKEFEALYRYRVNRYPSQGDMPSRINAMSQAGLISSAPGKSPLDKQIQQMREQAALMEGFPDKLDLSNDA